MISNLKPIDKVEKYYVGSVVKILIREPSSQKVANDKLVEAAQEHIRTSNRACCMSEVYKLGTKSFGINIKEL